MGGIGSSRWREYQKKSCIDACLAFRIKNSKKGFRIAVKTPKQLGPITVNICGSDSQPSKSYSISIEILTYDLERHSFNVELSSTNLNFGGIRYWLQCPICKNRKMKLYFSNKNLGCYLCQDLTYRIQQEHDKTVEKYIPKEIRNLIKYFKI